MTSSWIRTIILQAHQFAVISPIKDWFLLIIRTNVQQCSDLCHWNVENICIAWQWESELFRNLYFVCFDKQRASQPSATPFQISSSSSANAKKCWPFSPWNMILWCTKHISFHCEGAENAFFMPFSWLPIERNYVLWRLLILLISTIPFIFSIYHILDFWSKIRFRVHIIIIHCQMHPLKKSKKNWP